MQKFKYARDSLKFILQKYGIKEIYIPYYLCDVIRHSIVEVGCKPIFYHIKDNFMPDKIFSKTDWIVYPNYFGICDYNIDVLIKLYPKLIVDNAHAYYTKPRGFASFNSAKKFLPVSSGSNLWIGESDSIVPPDFRRRELFEKYHKEFKDTNLLEINIPENAIPFCYPYLASSEDEADKLVKELTSKGLTIYRYWNPLPKTYNEYKFYSRLVPITLSANNIQQDSLSHQTGVPGI